MNGDRQQVMALSCQEAATLGPRDSFIIAILSQNHREINIAESILVSIKVIIEGVFLIMMSWTIWLLVCQLWGEKNCCFLAGVWFPSKFDILIPKVTLYEGMWSGSYNYK